MKSLIRPSMGFLFAVTGVFVFYSGVAAKTEEQKTLEIVKDYLTEFFEGPRTLGKGRQSVDAFRESLKDTLQEKWGRAKEALSAHIGYELQGKLTLSGKPMFGKQAALDILQSLNSKMEQVISTILGTLDVLEQYRLSKGKDEEAIRQYAIRVEPELKDLKTWFEDTHKTLNSVAQKIKKSKTQLRKQRLVAELLAAVVDNIGKRLTAKNWAGQ